jgi:glycosyltransferase involved in cell wall biosynthesis
LCLSKDKDGRICGNKKNGRTLLQKDKMNEQEKIDWMVCVNCMTFNHAPYIKDTMNGFVIQETNFPFVCAIVDDASTDGEQEVINNYLNEHFDLEDKSIAQHEETADYVLTFARHNTNLNCFFAVFYLKYNHYSIKKLKEPYLTRWRNNAKYIAICEGDDRWINPNKLQKQFALLESCPNCNICTHNALEVTPDGNKRKFTNLPEDKTFGITRVMLMRWFTPTASFFYRNNVEIPPTYSKMGANGDMALLYTNLLKGKLYYSSDVMSVYNYATPGSLSSKTPKKVLYQKKINLFRAINKVTKYRYSYLTLPLIMYFSLKRLASRN